MERHYHLIGIGGIGMSGIAKLLLCRGFKVSGSDIKDSKDLIEIKNMGADISIGHSPANIKAADLVIYSSAIKEDNPERKEARKRGITVIKRAEALAMLMQDKIVITVTGSHGKTTTTSLISYLLIEAGLKPSVAIGGILRNIDANACIGEGKFFVAEADESDGSFLCYSPDYSIITNIDREHLDYYGNFMNELDTFKEFLRKTKDTGCVFACGDDKNLMDILEDYQGKKIIFGLREDYDIFAKNINIRGLSSEFDCYYKNKFIARFSLSLGGMHNISNVLAVIALGLELEIDLDFIKKALFSYQGALRRLEIKFHSRDYILLDDYAHHPTEIRATLLAAKNLNPNRMIAVFQPHRYSRTKILMEDFIKSFDIVDNFILTDIYPASESPIDGISSEVLYDKIKQYNPNKDIRLLPKEEINNYLLKIIRPGDLVITLGAGDITKVCDELANQLKEKS
jgi:UDP-N-acetylmuramate--alanine ligase